jgi:hypothetical protein
MTTIKKLWIGIGILALLSPLGLIIPALFGAGGAWGEWGLEEMKKLVGYIPEGMQKLAHIWKSPMPDYTVPGQKQGLAVESLGYVLSAIVGIAITAGAVYIITKLLGRKNGTE